MSQLTTLRLETQLLLPTCAIVDDLPGSIRSDRLRYAFLGLLAVNIFVVSAALCFAALYFSH